MWGAREGGEVPVGSVGEEKEEEEAAERTSHEGARRPSYRRSRQDSARDGQVIRSVRAIQLSQDPCV